MLWSVAGFLTLSTRQKDPSGIVRGATIMDVVVILVKAGTMKMSLPDGDKGFGGPLAKHCRCHVVNKVRFRRRSWHMLRG